MTGWRAERAGGGGGAVIVRELQWQSGGMALLQAALSTARAPALRPALRPRRLFSTDGSTIKGSSATKGGKAAEGAKAEATADAGKAADTTVSESKFKLPQLPKGTSWLQLGVAAFGAFTLFGDIFRSSPQQVSTLPSCLPPSVFLLVDCHRTRAVNNSLSVPAPQQVREKIATMQANKDAAPASPEAPVVATPTAAPAAVVPREAK